VSVEMIDSSGQVVRRLNMGTLQAGNQQFAWDGLDANGERAPAGTYTMRASLVQGNTRTDLDTSAIAEVRSVALGSAGLTLELFGLPPVALADIQQII
jgi:flagellar basal-body rod modification protein FlgD